MYVFNIYIFHAVVLYIKVYLLPTTAHTYTCSYIFRLNYTAINDDGCVVQPKYVGKGKVYPRTGHEGLEGRRGIALLFL
jgi:hypothetical protein